MQGAVAHQGRVQSHVVVRQRPKLPQRLWNTVAHHEQAELLPHTAPISGYRGRAVTGRLLVQLPVGQDVAPNHPSTATPQHKMPADSALQLVYPFKSDPELLEEMTLDRDHTSPMPGIPTSFAAAKTVTTSSSTSTSSSSPRTPLYHTGLFLEDLDTFAADVAARHVDLSNKKLVTAYVDTILWLQHQSQHNPTAMAPTAASAPEVAITGQVTWVGRSSLEVTLEVTREGAESSESAGHKRERELVGVARFVMAARDLTMKRSMAVPTLAVEGGSVEEQLVAEGAHRAQVRQHRKEKREAEASQPLSDDEARLLSDLIGQLRGVRVHSDSSDSGSQVGTRTPGKIIASSNGSNGASTQGGSDGGQHGIEAEAPLPPKLMRATEKAMTVIPLYEDRNTTGTVFGGQLLRWGHDMAVAVGAAHAGQACRLVAMRDVPFMGLVPLGRDFHLTGKVVYVEGDMLHVHVRSYREEDVEGEKEKESKDAAKPQKDTGPYNQKHSHRTLPQNSGQGQPGKMGANVYPMNGAINTSVNPGKDSWDDFQANSGSVDIPASTNAFPFLGGVSRNGSDVEGILQAPQPRRVQTHSFYIALATNDGGAAAPVVPETAAEVREWVHARRGHEELLQRDLASDGVGVAGAGGQKEVGRVGNATAGAGGIGKTTQNKSQVASAAAVGA